MKRQSIIYRIQDDLAFNEELDQPIYPLLNGKWKRMTGSVTVTTGSTNGFNLVSFRLMPRSTDARVIEGSTEINYECYQYFDGVNDALVVYDHESVMNFWMFMYGATAAEQRTLDVGFARQVQKGADILFEAGYQDMAGGNAAGVYEISLDLQQEIY